MFLKGIPKEGFLFNSDIKIVNARLKFPTKKATEKVKFNFYKNDICMANLKSFSNQRSYSASKLSSWKSSLIFCLFSYT